MDGQLHITHRGDYLRGRDDGRHDARHSGDYWPSGRSRGDTDSQRAYRLGYSDGWAEAWPCNDGTCGHLAHVS